jgi:hypothetical protein
MIKVTCPICESNLELKDGTKTNTRFSCSTCFAQLSLKIEGKRPVEILPRDFGTRLTAKDAALKVGVHNCLNRAIRGRLGQWAPGTPVADLALAPAQTRRLEVGRNGAARFFAQAGSWFEQTEYGWQPMAATVEKLAGAAIRQRPRLGALRGIGAEVPTKILCMPEDGRL